MRESHTITMAVWISILALILTILSACKVPQTKPEEPKFDLEKYVQDSECSKIFWKDRGKAPSGFILGMTKLHAQQFCSIKSGKVLKFLTEAEASNDIFTYYSDKLGPIKSKYGTHIALNTFLFGLGMRESSGKHCEGRDRSASNVKADSAEAGMFQTSYDVRYTAKAVQGLHNSFNEPCLLDEFSKNVICDVQESVTWGDGEDGRKFQKKSKECPAFAATVTSIALRFSGGARSHYGPVRRKEVEVQESCSKMLKELEAQLNSQTCEQLK